MAYEDPKYPVKLTVTFAGCYGATLIATLISLVIYGIALFMSMLYFKSHAARDSLVLKGTIVVLTILSSLQTVFTSHEVYNTFVTKRGDLVKLDEIISSTIGTYTCIYLAAFVAEIYFCNRIWVVGTHMNAKARYFVVPAMLLGLMQLGAGLAQVTVMGLSKHYTKLTTNTRLLIQTTAIEGTGATLCDIIISATLCYIFHSNRSPIGRTNTMINKLITYAINRAIATSFCAVAFVLLYYFASGTYYFMVPLLASTHFYLISAVSMLIAREGLREEADPSFHISHLEMRTTALSSGGTTASKTNTSGYTLPTEKESPTG